MNARDSHDSSFSLEPQQRPNRRKSLAVREMVVDELSNTISGKLENLSKRAVQSTPGPEILNSSFGKTISLLLEQLSPAEQKRKRR